jgi:TldD protein
VGADRREFIKTGAAVLAALGLSRPGSRPPPDFGPTVRELCQRALDAARSAGAQYADIRVIRRRSQSVSTRESQFIRATDSESYGFGVRVLVQGAWGFAASRELTRDEVTRVAQAAVAQARANRRAMSRPVVLAPTPPVKDGRWRSPIEIDPFTIPVEEKVALLLRANGEALKVAGARYVSSSMAFVLEDKTFASTDDIFTVQQIYRCLPGVGDRGRPHDGRLSDPLLRRSRADGAGL